MIITGTHSVNGPHKVFIGDTELLPETSLKVMRISPTGFCWGYGGAGPQQLALALLLHFTNEKTARALCSSFTQRFVAKLPQMEDFEISETALMLQIAQCAKAYQGDVMYIMDLGQENELYEGTKKQQVLVS